MALEAPLLNSSDLRERSGADVYAFAEPQEEKTMTVPQPCPRRRKLLDAGVFQGEICSFRLHLAAGGKAAKMVRTYTDAVAWFAAAHLIPRTSRTRWEQVDGHDVQRWLVNLLARYSDAYASNQYRALQQFFRWLAEEEQIRDPGRRAGRDPLRPARRQPTSAIPYLASAIPYPDPHGPRPAVGHRRPA